jgi:hypothetical protein
VGCFDEKKLLRKSHAHVPLNGRWSPTYSGLEIVLQHVCFISISEYALTKTAVIFHTQISKHHVSRKMPAKNLEIAIAVNLPKLKGTLTRHEIFCTRFF